MIRVSGKYTAYLQISADQWYAMNKYERRDLIDDCEPNLDADVEIIDDDGCDDHAEMAREMDDDARRQGD